MKREGRQHGMVRAYENLSLPSDPRPPRKMINQLISSTPAAGLFTRVPTKPTNHSKYTSRCGRPRCRGCHRHPVCKSIDKVKGAHKLRSTMDGPHALKFYGFSASGVLNYLDRLDHRDCDDDEEVDVLQASCDSSSLVLEIHEDVGDVDVDVLQASSDSSSLVLEIEEVSVVDDDEMGFCEVGLVWEPVDGDESWCLIHEI